MGCEHIFSRWTADGEHYDNSLCGTCFTLTLTLMGFIESYGALEHLCLWSSAAEVPLKERSDFYAVSKSTISHKFLLPVQQQNKKYD